MQNFKIWLENSEQDNERRLWVYQCPQCLKNELYNGIPNTGTMFRGGGKCANCGHSCSVLDKEPVSKQGPLLKS